MPALASLFSSVPINASRKSLQAALASCLTLLSLLACFADTASAQSAPIPIPFLPKYEVLTVVYAPPGSASSVTYGNSNLVGSSNSFLTSISNNVTESTSTTTGFSLFGIGSTTTNTSSDGWGDAAQSSTSLSVQTTNGNSVTTAGPISSALGVNHDNDVIYIWLNPVVMATVPNTTTTSPIPLTWTGLDFNSCDLTDSGDAVNAQQLVNGCDPNQYPFPDIVGIPVWCLKNPYYPGESCAQWLPFTQRPWDLTPWSASTTTAPPLGPGLTLQDYADILQADPFVTQTLVPANYTPGFYCHPTYGVNLDPNDTETFPTLTTSQVSGKTFPVNFCGVPPANGIMQRFDPYDTVEYPEPGINGEPQTYSGSFTYTTTSVLGSSATTTSTQGSSTSTSNSFNAASAISLAALSPYTAFLGALGLGFDFSITNSSSSTWSWAQTNATTNTSSTTNSASYSITGPQLSDNYVGPTTFNVYKDNVMGTFAFYSDQQRQQAPVLLANTTSCAAPICVEQGGSLVTSPLTFTGTTPVAGVSSQTFALTLLNNSLNQMTMVAPAVTFSDPAFSIVSSSDFCSNNVLPKAGTCTLSIQFSPVTGDAPNTVHASYPVTANLIAAGTENVSSYENVLVTSTGVLATGTATPTAGDYVGATLLPANPNYTPQPNIYNFGAFTGGGQTEIFTFKNYNSGSATISASPKGVILSDSADFEIVSGTDHCSGQVIASGGSCAITIQYEPPTSVGTTGIAVVGTVPNAPTGSLPVPLATAAATGTLGSAATLSLSSSVLEFEGDYDGQTQTATETVTNTSSYPLAVTAEVEAVAINNMGQSEYTASDTTTCSNAGNNPLPAGKSCTFTVSVKLENPCMPAANCGTGYLFIFGSNNGQTLVSEPAVDLYVTNSSSPAVIVKMSGAEQNRQVAIPGKQASASIMINGVLPSIHKVDVPINDVQEMTLTVGGYTYQAHASLTMLKGQSPAALFADVVNAVQGPVTAKAVGNSIQLVSRVAGTAGNLPFTANISGGFVVSPGSGTLSGGTNPTTTKQYDNGTMNATIGSASASVSWGQSSTPNTIAQAVATSLTAASQGKFTATASGDAVTITPLSGGVPNVGVVVKSLEGFNPASFDALVEQ